ncbi:MAG: hypothetical protein QOH21_2518, partial [Acidobacteriota bacterium]|nr:hypothetical protein [Acidobacteriota bacterium]
FVYGWTLAPLAKELAARSRRAVVVVLTLLTLTLSYYAVMVLIHDRFTPLEFVLWARKNPGTRMVWFNPSRAASVADRRAGPDDKIAVDGSFDTWLWPAYGAKLSRPVLLLPDGATPADIPDDVKWVIVDRSWSAMWGHKNLTTMGKMWKLVAKGTPPESDVRLFHALEHDPRFRLVFREEHSNQAVFRRVGTY